MSLQAIRARAPLRLGLAGGGTDLSPYSDRFGGAVLNITINRHAYAFVEPSADGRLHFSAQDIEIEESFDSDPAACVDARLAIHAGVYRRMIAQFRGGEIGAGSGDAGIECGLGAHSIPSGWKCLRTGDHKITELFDK